MGYSPGTWKAEVLAAGLTSSPNKGTPQVAIEFKLLEGPDAGGRITHYAAITEKRLEYTVKELRACGWSGDDLDDLSSVVAGTPVDLVLAEEEYEGKTRTKVAFINEPGRMAGGPAPKGVGQAWRDRIRALSGASGKAPF